MPILASMGALTYTKKGETGTISEYWAVRTGGLVSYSSNDIYADTSNQQFYTFGDNWNSMRIDGYNNPNITYNKTWDLTVATSSDGNKIVYNPATNTITGIGEGRMPYAPAFPYYSVSSGMITLIDPSTYDTTTYYSYPQYGAPPTGSSDLYKYFQDAIVDSENNYYIVGTDTEYYGGSQWMNHVYLWKVSSGITTLASTRMGDTFTGYFSNAYTYAPVPAVTLDSSDNPIMSYDWRESTSGSNLSKIVLRKLTKTVTVIGGFYNGQATLWTTGLIPAGTERVTCTGITTDSTGNIYAIYPVSTAAKTYIVKYNSTGTVIWQKSVNTPLTDIKLKNDTEIYIAGWSNASTITNIYFAKIDDTGALQFQRQFTNSFYNRKATIKLIDGNAYIGCTYWNAGTTNYTQPTLIKVPDDGTIPGSGSYTFSDGDTFGYQTANRTFTTTSMSTWSPSTTTVGENIREFTEAGQTSTVNPNTRAIGFM